MIDIFIPLGGGSFWDNNELRYCLRSIEKYLHNYGRIFIIGRKPDWIQNIEHLAYEDLTPFKEKNIFTKVKMACDIKEMSENFLFMNDDHFLVDHFDAPTFPYFYKCMLERSIERLGKGKYLRALLATYNELCIRGLPTYNFDGHIPIVYNKQNIKHLNEQYPWDRYDTGFVLKSLYANTFACQPILEHDCKLNTQMLPYQILDTIRDKKCFSIGNPILQPDPENLHVVLEQLYTVPSKYEL